MTTVDRSVLVLNVVLAAAAGGVNLWATLRPGPFGQWAPLRASITFLAFLYAFAYGLLASGMVPLEVWSPVMRGVSLVAWPLVWIAPPLLSWQVWHKANRHAKGQIKEIRQKAALRG